MSTDRLPTPIHVPNSAEVAHLVARDNETRRRPTTAERLAAEDRAAAEYLPTLPEDDVE